MGTCVIPRRGVGAFQEIDEDGVEIIETEEERSTKE
jgi:hypothetical protein